MWVVNWFFPHCEILKFLLNSWEKVMKLNVWSKNSILLCYQRFECTNHFHYFPYRSFSYTSGKFYFPFNFDRNFSIKFRLKPCSTLSTMYACEISIYLIFIVFIIQFIPFNMSHSLSPWYFFTKNSLYKPQKLLFGNFEFLGRVKTLSALVKHNVCEI